MKIVHVTYSDSEGGAARAAYRIHQALLHFGLDSQMWVVKKNMNDESVIEFKADSIWQQIKYRFFKRKYIRLKRKWKPSSNELFFFGDFGINILKQINKANIDLVHLHCIDNILTIKDLSKVNKPIVWTMHDMWPFCGAEHYMQDDCQSRFKVGYSKQNLPENHIGPDMSLNVWNLKMRLWQNVLFYPVSPSLWLKKQAAESVLFSRYNISYIPYPIKSEDFWIPLNSKDCRSCLDLPISKRLILMGADGGTQQYRKGGDLLWDIVSKITQFDKQSFEIIIFGEKRIGASVIDGININWVGRISDDRLLRMYYCAADLVIVPSRQDNLPCVAMESMSCGTPVAAFAVGGLCDLIMHCENGWLSAPFDTSDLAKGIIWMLEDTHRLHQLGINARKFIVENHNQLRIGKKYSHFYESILTKSRQID